MVRRKWHGMLRRRYIICGCLTDGRVFQCWHGSEDLLEKRLMGLDLQWSIGRWRVQNISTTF